MESCDVLIVGGGMAGAAAGYELARDRRVVVLEQEAQPGYHSTGRSAAAYIPSYGGEIAALRKLTAASLDFLRAPPLQSVTEPLLSPRGLLTITPAANAAALDEILATLRARAVEVEKIEHARISAMVPALQPDYTHGALYEPGVCDIDVHALHDGYLRGLRQRGGRVVTSAALETLNFEHGHWQCRTAQGDFSAALLVNAAGAWADQVAARAGVATVGLTPMRRTACLLDPPAGLEVGPWPLIMDSAGAFYFKPDAGKLLASPADETPSEACDARPEEIDKAYAAHYAETVLGFTVRRIPHAWAGLRSFVPDRAPVIGFAPDQPAFFWLAGQGGHGIQTAPGNAMLAAALIRGEPLPAPLAAQSFELASVAPGRTLSRDGAPVPA